MRKVRLQEASPDGILYQQRQARTGAMGYGAVPAHPRRAGRRTEKQECNILGAEHNTAKFHF